MSLALVSTPVALMLGVWGGRRIAAAWLGCAALAWAVTGDRAYSEWWYGALFYGPQLIAALLLLRRAAEPAPMLPVIPSVATSSAATPGRRIAWCFALVVGLGHAGLGLWLAIAAGVQTAWTLGWWMAGVVSLLSTLPAIMAERSGTGFRGPLAHRGCVPRRVLHRPGAVPEPHPVGRRPSRVVVAAAPSRRSLREETSTRGLTALIPAPAEEARRPGLRRSRAAKPPAADQYRADSSRKRHPGMRLPSGPTAQMRRRSGHTRPD